MEAAAKTRTNPLLWLVSIGFFMETLDSTIVNTALPAMARSLKESPFSMHSVVIAYSLTLALLIPASGWIADKIGIKRAFLTAIVVFTLGSLLCALSPNLHFIVCARILQGLGGSLLMPIGRLAVLRVFPREQFLAAISFVAMPALIGPLIGPTLGGLFVQIASWHWIFLINLPIGIAGFFATMKFMPTIPSVTVGKFDFVGFGMLALSMVSILMALDGLSENDFGEASVLVLLVFGFACLVSYLLHASRSLSPVFSLKLFRTRSFAIGLLGNLFARIGSSSMPFLIPLFLQISLGYSALQAGLTMVPIALASIVTKRFVSRLVEKVGYRKFLLVNTLIVGASIMSFMLVSPREPSWVRVIQFIIFGGVNSMQFSAMNSITLKDLEPAFASSGNSLFSMVQMLAISLGVAAAGALLNTFSQHWHASELNPDPLASFHATFVCLGFITCISTVIFAHLSKKSAVYAPELREG